jgi:hypothetical protein
MRQMLEPFHAGNHICASAETVCAYTKRTQEQNRCVSLKGLSHDMDLAFDDINGYF